ncbi:exodeoxyribonuclease VII large subunit [Stomatohabitans albus]|uniref:exodeoxyribonuclease VII large subunit n=1 Tax=Stomatohabitans albus TaxID=3110766 RepID=UPI00300D9A81
MDNVTGTPEEPRPLRFVNESLTAYIDKLGFVWISAEITQWNTRRGAVYGTFEEDGHAFSFSIWQGRRPVLPDPLPKVGDQVVAKVTPTFWTKRGQIQLDVVEVRQAGIGQLIVQIEERRQRLAQEGLFDPDRKRTWPLLPQKIGLVVGVQTMAEQDVKRNALARWPGATFEVVNTPVQGADCAPQVIQALERLEADPAVEVIIVARGGGDYRDLVGFSDESLVRFVADMTTPVISAIGHEPDHPILDDVADYRASTPTGAGQVVVLDAIREYEEIQRQRRYLHQTVHQFLDHEHERIQTLRTHIARPDALVAQWHEQIAHLREQLAHIVLRNLDLHRANIATLRATLDAISPNQVLERGYALAMVNGDVISSIDQAPIGTQLTVRLRDGSLHSAVLATVPTPPLESHTTPGDQDD